MSLIVTLSPASSVLAGNPVRLDISSEEDSFFTLSTGGTDIYRGSGSGTYFVYLQDIIASYLVPQVMFSDDDRLLIPVTGNGKTFQITVETATLTRTISFKAYLGGMSRSVIRSLHESNPFTARFLSGTGNIFFSLRETEGMIVLRETELSPLLFIYPSGTLTIVSEQHTLALSGTNGSLYGLNIERIRRTIYDTYHVIANTFTLKLGTSKVIDIVITPATLSREHYYLRYLNSLGAYDMLDLTGTATRGQDDADDNSHGVFDKTVDGYVLERERRSTRLSLKLDSGILSEYRMILFEDMLSSSDVTLLGYHGQDIKVIPEADSLDYRHNSHKAQSIGLTLRFADEDTHFSLDNVTEQLGSGSLHTSQFTSQFI